MGRQLSSSQVQKKKVGQSDLVIEQGSVAGIGVYCIQQTVKHMTQNLQVWGAGGKKLQLHCTDLWEQQQTPPGPVRHRHQLTQRRRLRLHS